MAQTETKKMPCARALFGFEGQSKHELNFSAGVSIMLLRRIDENWLEGQLDGRVGIFPANHVKIELGSPSVSHESALARSGKPYAIAVHPFQGGQQGDLSFNKGELVELIASVDSGWIKGRIQHRSGIFPASFVQIIKPLKEVSKLTTNGMVSELATFSMGMRHSSSDDGPPSSPDYSESSDTLDELRPPIPKPRIIPRHASAPSVISKMGGAKRERSSATDDEEEMEHIYENIPTPSRSAPAPPNAADHQPQKFGTLPKPKPRKKPATLTRHPSTTDHSQNIVSLESQLTIEQKMLESAENMLQTGPSAAKREKLEEAVKNHQTNIQRIKTEIKDANVEHQSSQTAVPAHATPPSRPRPPKSPLNRQEKMRSRTVDELVFTEKDFHHQMDLCTKKVLPALKEVPDINTDVLFGNLSDVTRLSRDFLSALEDSCRHEQRVGEVFVTFAPKLRDVYAIYCRNHDTASSTLEKYMEMPSTAQRIRQAMDELRGEIQAWDLQSLLIKPVQRVLKYPLLLDKLTECTPPKHPDYKHVLEARVVIEKVAQYINEIKRRKDIVERYTGPTKDVKGTVSMHSLQKKVRRFQQAFTQLTGLRSKTVDPKFDELEQKVLSLETLLRTLVKDINLWQEEIVHMVEGREQFVDGMALYCSEGQSPWLSNYQELIPTLKQAIKTHSRFVKDHVTSPLESLISLFQDPLHLTHKRRDKLLDYDHMQYALEHAAEAEPDKIKQLNDDCLLAKRNYEALNAQLIEELPHFLEAAAKMLQHQLTVLVQAQYAFHDAVSKIFSSYFDKFEESSELQVNHLTAIAQVSQKLVQLSFVPASLATNFTSKMAIPRRVSEGSVSPQVSPQASPRTLKSLVSPLRGTFVEEEPEIDEEEGPPVGSKLKVLYDFEAQDKAELSVECNEIVTLLCPHDRIGCTEWWLVETERGKGYVPATYLEENYDSLGESASSGVGSES